MADIETALKHLELARVALVEPSQDVDLDAAPWMEIARAEEGVKEIVGDEDNPRVLQYLRSTSLGKWAASRDETPWCSAFVNWCITQAGLEGTNSAMARSWLGWGVDLAMPRPGCVTRPRAARRSARL